MIINNEEVQGCVRTVGEITSEYWSLPGLLYSPIPSLTRSLADYVVGSHSPGGLLRDVPLVGAGCRKMTKYTRSRLVIVPISDS